MCACKRHNILVSKVLAGAFLAFFLFVSPGVAQFRILAIWARERPFRATKSRLTRGGGRGACPPENFENLSTLRCNLVQSGRLNLANARIPY